MRQNGWHFFFNDGESRVTLYTPPRWVIWFCQRQSTPAVGVHQAESNCRSCADENRPLSVSPSPLSSELGTKARKNKLACLTGLFSPLDHFYISFRVFFSSRVRNMDRGFTRQVKTVFFHSTRCKIILWRKVAGWTRTNISWTERWRVRFTHISRMIRHLDWIDSFRRNK